MTISCEQAIKWLWEYLDGNLGEVEREKIERHLGICRRCSGEAEFAEELRRFLRAAAEVELPGDVRARLASTLDELEAR